MNIDINTLNVEEVRTLDDINAIVEFHKDNFTNNFTGKVGKKFLRVYFQRIIALPSQVLYVCKDRGVIVGLIAGASTHKGFNSISLIFWGGMATLWQLIVKPSVFVLILRHIKRMLTSFKETCEAELLTLAVGQDYRRSGLGTKLVEALESFFQEKGVKRYEIFTDIEEGKGHFFYKKLGCELVREVEFMCLLAHVYHKVI